MKTKVSKTYNILIRLAIILLTFGFLYDQIFYRKNLEEIAAYIPEISGSFRFYFNLALATLLIPVNQFLEIIKWKYLIDKLEKVSLWSATKAVFAGISVSMFMPNRVGDYLGRVFVLKKADRLQAVLITILGSMAQLLITIIYGFLAVLFFFPWYYDMSDQFNVWIYSGMVLMILVLTFIFVFAYLNFGGFSSIIERISGRFYKRIRKYSEVFSWYGGKNLLLVLLLSALRYVIFSFQFYLLLRAFYVPVSYYSAIVLIGLVYLLMTIIPTVALTELGVRGSVSLFVFSLYLEPVGKWTDTIGLGVASAVSVLWVMNLALPALIGLIFVYSLRFFRTNNGNGN
ncbi:MAG: flippase-like domain-containing protein [Chlorobi bacterium]|nr:flippase-like domain-containing protein [Chlorobiota bacterium]